MNSNEKLIFLYALEHNKFKNIKSVFFIEDYLGVLYGISKEYYEEHGDLPKEFFKTLYHVIRNNNTYIKQLGITEVLQDSIDSDLKQIISSVFNDDITGYDFLKKSFDTWVKIKSFEFRYQSMASYMSAIDIDEENVDHVIEKAGDIFNKIELQDDGDDDGLDFLNPEHHDFSDVVRIKTGKKFLDKALGGGIKPKTLTIYLGQQGKGKSLWLCNDASYYMRNGFNVVFISGEMDAGDVLKRIGAMTFKIPIAKYEEYTKRPDYIAQQITNLKFNNISKIGQLRVKQMSSPSTKDIANYVRSMEQKWNEKCHVVIVDYIKTTSNWRNVAGNDWKDWEAIASDMRVEGMKNNWLMLSAMQIKQAAWDKSDYDIDAIAESSAIAHHADLVLGIIQDPIMTQERIFWLKVLKMRGGSGLGKKCKFEINAHTLEISETDEVMLHTGM